MSSAIRFIRTKIIFACLLFSLISFVIGAPTTSWWFYESDEFDTLYRAFKSQSLTSCLNFFIQGDVRGLLPDRAGFGTHFFDAFYRPLVLIIEAIRFYFFQLSGLSYHLSNVAVHAFNVSLIFWISARYVSFFSATLAALFFGFHPQIAYSFGRIDCLQYCLNATLIVLIIMLFKQYLDTQRKTYYLLAGILFILSAFLRETAFVLPIILTIGSYLYNNHGKQLSLKNFITTLPHYLWITRYFWYLLVALATMRIYLHPISLQTSPLPWLTRESTIIKKCYFLYSTTAAIISDIFSLSWFNPGHKNIKIAVTISVLTFFTFLFLYNKHKIWVLFFFGSALLMLWPAYLTGGYHPRYLYEAMPFATMFFICSFTEFKKTSKTIHYFSYTILAILIGFYGYLNASSFMIKRNNLAIVSSAFYELVQNNDITNRPLLFIGIPSKPFGDGLPNLVRIIHKNNQHPIYFDCILPSPQFPFNKETWYLRVSELIGTNEYTIDSDHNGIIHITGKNNLPMITSKWGTINIISPMHVSFEIDQVIKQKTLIITWDYKRNTFKELNIKLHPGLKAGDFEVQDNNY